MTLEWEIQRKLEKIMTSIIANAQRTSMVLLFFPVSHGQKCEEGHFACPSGNCISSVWLCDGQKDCEDGADEFQCGKQANLILHGRAPAQQTEIMFCSLTSRIGWDIWLLRGYLFSFNKKLFAVMILFLKRSRPATEDRERQQMIVYHAKGNFFSYCSHSQCSWDCAKWMLLLVWKSNSDPEFWVMLWRIHVFPFSLWIIIYNTSSVTINLWHQSLKRL